MTLEKHTEKIYKFYKIIVKAAQSAAFILVRCDMAFKQIEKLAYKYSDSEALLTLGRMYLKGYGVKADVYKALNCFTRLAKKYQSAEGYYYVGYMLACGLTGKVAKKQAVVAFQKSSELGYSAADCALKMIYDDALLGQEHAPEYAVDIRKKLSYAESVFAAFEKSVAIDKEIAELKKSKDHDKALLAKKQEESFSLCEKSAEGGSADAKIALALKLLEGVGAPKNAARAIAILEECDNENFPLATYTLGCLYSDGNGVACNNWKAYSYFKKAAEKDYVDAIINVAYCDVRGIGTTRNEKAGLSSLKKLSKSNDRACFYMGLCYLKGYAGVRIDVEFAMECFEKAANGGVADAYYERAVFNKSRGVDIEKVKTDLLSAVALEHMNAAALLSTILSEGARKNELAEARDLDDAGIAAHNAESYCTVAKKSLAGIGYAKNFDNAKSYFETAAKLGSLEASEFIYNSYKNGENGFKQNEKKAFGWMERCARNGGVHLYFQLAEQYFNGGGLCRSDMSRAAYWYAKTMNESDVQIEVAASKKKLSNFVIDVYGNWNLKDDAKRLNKQDANGSHGQPGKKIENYARYDDLDDIAFQKIDLKVAKESEKDKKNNVADSFKGVLEENKPNPFEAFANAFRFSNSENNENSDSQSLESSDVSSVEKEVASKSEIEVEVANNNESEVDSKSEIEVEVANNNESTVNSEIEIEVANNNESEVNSRNEVKVANNNENTVNSKNEIEVEVASNNETVEDKNVVNAEEMVAAPVENVEEKIATVVAEETGNTEVATNANENAKKHASAFDDDFDDFDVVENI